MLYRKRAWDMMQAEFPVVREDVALNQVVDALEKHRIQYPGANYVLVMNAGDRLAGVITMRDILKAMGPELLKSVVKSRDDDSYEEVFRLACQLGGQSGIRKMIRRDVPVIRPNDTMDRIIEVFLDHGQTLAVVEEGEKIIGVVSLPDIYGEIVRNMR